MPYARALIARLAMSREEAVYLDRTKDDDGQPLRGDYLCAPNYCMR